jgi:hypothetical protein
MKVGGWGLGTALWLCVAKLCLEESSAQLLGKSSDSQSKFAENSGFLFLVALSAFVLPIFGKGRQGQRLPFALFLAFLLIGASTIILFHKIPFQVR